MTIPQFDQFLTAVLLICAAGVILNVAKFKSRGMSARYLAAAFCSLGVGVFLIKLGANQYVMGLSGAVTFGFLAADVVFRLKNPSKRGHR